MTELLRMPWTIKTEYKVIFASTERNVAIVCVVVWYLSSTHTQKLQTNNNKLWQLAVKQDDIQQRSYTE